MKEVGFLSALEVLYLEKEKVDGPDALLKQFPAEKWTFLDLPLSKWMGRMLLKAIFC